MTQSLGPKQPGESLREIARRARGRLLRMHFEAGVGHLGGNLSSLDCLLCLYHRVLRADDAFVLSKGHGAGALYVALWSVGRLSDDDLRSFHADGTHLAGHPACGWSDDIGFATGSLGHGLSLAAGMALARRIQEKPGRIYCLTSDGEWNEGSTWEALMFARHHGLSNLTFLVDANGLQGMGETREILDLSPLAEKFRSFGVETLEVDGHAPDRLCEALEPTGAGSGPRAVVCHTVKGHGVSFLEGKMEWHYLSLSAEQFSRAIQETEAR